MKSHPLIATNKESHNNIKTGRLNICAGVMRICPQLTLSRACDPTREK